MFPEILMTIKGRKSNEVYVVGHTDLVGTETYNIGLSSKRANHVRDLLLLSGIKPGILVVSFYGKTRPLVATQNEVSEPRNRRVEVIVR
jgi:outer membrane protein OmpA-like peptidoglycan-associated protein